jgi:hypothetical protein
MPLHHKEWYASPFGTLPLRFRLDLILLPTVVGCMRRLFTATLCVLLPSVSSLLWGLLSSLEDDGSFFLVVQRWSIRVQLIHRDGTMP